MKVEVKVLSHEKETKEAIRKKFVQGLYDCEHIILPAAQALAPERTGKYKRSMSYAVNETKLEGALSAGIYKPGDPNYSPQAHIIEFGSHKMAPLAPLRKAAEQSRSAMGEAIAKRCKEPV